MPPEGVFFERRNVVRDHVAKGWPAGTAFIAATPPNVYYLTGLWSSNAAVLIAPDGLDVLCTDGRYAERARTVASNCEVLTARGCIPTLIEVCSDRGLHAVLLEEQLPYGVINSLSKDLPITTSEALVEQFRLIKDEYEVMALRRACQITAEAFTHIASIIRVGDTEIAIARRLEALFGELGAEDRAFPSIVAGGPNSAVPHHQPSNRPLEAGDLLVIDAGALVAGYHADMTRTFSVATAPTAQGAAWQEVVQRAREAAVAACMPGTPIDRLDQAAREILDQSPYRGWMHHGLGHGVGLQIHEAPMLTGGSNHTVQTGMVMAIEPGIYQQGVGGVRIEDSFLVTGDGPQVLTSLVEVEVDIGIRPVGEAS